MTAPLVSVVVPTYNSLSFLKECLGSLKRQSLPSDVMQVIVVDDGSTDGTWEYLCGLEKNGQQIIAISQTHTGSPSAGRNKGIDAATGRYIYFVDSDDWLGDDALRRLTDAAESYGSDIVLGRGKGVDRGVHRATFRRTVVDADIIADGAWVILGPWKLFRTSLVRKLQVYFPEDMRQGEDQIFVASCYFAASRITILSDYDYYYVRGRGDGQNLTRQSQPLNNKLLTTSRLTAIVVANVPPAERDQYLRRVFLKTLPPALNTSFADGPTMTREEFLLGLRRDVLPHLSDELLHSAKDHLRIRLVIARDGDADRLNDFNRRATQGLRVVSSAAGPIYDLGSTLNAIVPESIRAVRDQFHVRHTVEHAYCDPARVTLFIRAVVPELRAQPYSCELKVSADSGGVTQVLQPAHSIGRDHQFAIDAETLRRLSSTGNESFSLSLVCRLEEGVEARTPVDWLDSKAKPERLEERVVLCPDGESGYLSLQVSKGSRVGLRLRQEPAAQSARVISRKGAEITWLTPHGFAGRTYARICTEGGAALAEWPAGKPDGHGHVTVALPVGEVWSGEVSILELSSTKFLSQDWLTAPRGEGRGLRVDQGTKPGAGVIPGNSLGGRMTWLSRPRAVATRSARHGRALLTEWRARRARTSRLQ